jgi:hypothetical protein
VLLVSDCVDQKQYVPGLPPFVQSCLEVRPNVCIQVAALLNQSIAIARNHRWRECLDVRYPEWPASTASGPENDGLAYTTHRLLRSGALPAPPRAGSAARVAAPNG